MFITDKKESGDYSPLLISVRNYFLFDLTRTTPDAASATTAAVQTTTPVFGLSST